MPKPAAHKAEGIQFSFVAVRTLAGKPEVLALDESSDPALDLFAKLKASRGCDDKGKRLYTHAVLFLRSRSNRRAKFAE